MKRIRLNFFQKTFLLTIAMLLLVTTIAYVILYALLPQFYKQYKTEQYDGLITELIEDISTFQSPTEEAALLTSFAEENSVFIVVLNESDEPVYFSSQGTYFVVERSVTDTSEEQHTELDGEPSNTASENDVILIDNTYVFNEETRYLQIMIPLQPLTEAKDVIINIYPFAALICVIFSLLVALLFSKSVVSPIQKIRLATKEMARLEPNAEISIDSEDEIGELSDDINRLYHELLGTINTLKQEIDKVSASENKKIDFLRTVSHELKTPLASANALIEGIIYEIPPYDKNQKEYLHECKTFLNKAIYLTKESLNLSQDDYKESATVCDLRELIAEVSSGYKVILRSKQISYIETLPDKCYISTRIYTFSRVLSNIFSNAANYTPEKGEIQVRYVNNPMTKQAMLIIENTCTPIAEEELARLFSPFSSGPEHHKSSNGLGLYIVMQLLDSLHMEYTFKPSDDNTRMVFTIYLQNQEIRS